MLKINDARLSSKVIFGLNSKASKLKPVLKLNIMKFKIISSWERLEHNIKQNNI